MSTEFAVRPPKPLFWILQEKNMFLYTCIKTWCAIDFCRNLEMYTSVTLQNICNIFTYRNDKPLFISLETITLENPCTLLFFISWSKHCIQIKIENRNNSKIFPSEPSNEKAFQHFTVLHAITGQPEQKLLNKIFIDNVHMHRLNIFCLQLWQHLLLRFFQVYLLWVRMRRWWGHGLQGEIRFYLIMSKRLRANDRCAIHAVFNLQHSSKTEKHYLLLTVPQTQRGYQFWVSSFRSICRERVAVV
jgi:hypothetical protein